MGRFETFVRFAVTALVLAEERQPLLVFLGGLQPLQQGLFLFDRPLLPACRETNKLTDGLYQPIRHCSPAVRRARIAARSHSSRDTPAAAAAAIVARRIESGRRTSLDVSGSATCCS